MLNNIEVFEETLDFSDSILYTETMDLKKNTEVIINGSIYLKDLKDSNNQGSKYRYRAYF